MMMRILSCIFLTVCIAACTHVGIAPVTQAADNMSRQILVTTRQASNTSFSFNGNASGLSLERAGSSGPTAAVNRVLDRIADEYQLERVDGWMISSLGVYCEVFELEPGQDRDEILRLISADPRVESVQAMNLYETEAVTYDDPFAAMQSSVMDLALESAHEQATGRGITVAVIDSMVDNRHPEMRGRVPIRRDLVPTHRVAGRAEVHGTAMAGVIASKANNAEGIVGVAPDAEIVSLRACWTVDESSGRAMCSSLSLAQSLEVALRIGVDVVNMSLAGPRDPLLERMIDNATEAGVVIVAALPEDAGDENNFPASHPGVIAAGLPGAAAGFDKHVLRAPGNEVLSTVPNASYAFFSGNSVSAAFISGVAALLLERRPDIGTPELERLLAETSSDRSVNACLAVARLVQGGGCPPVQRFDTGIRQAAR